MRGRAFIAAVLAATGLAATAAPAHGEESGPPALTVTTEGPLPDNAEVAVHGTGFEPGSFVVLRECAWTDAVVCLDAALGFFDVDDTGTLDVAVPVTRVKGVDCAAVPFSCQVWAGPFGTDGTGVTAAGLEFDATNPPAQPSLAVEPETGLLDGQSVTVTVTGLPAGGEVDVEQCAVDGDSELACRFAAFDTLDGDGATEVTAEVRRRVDALDCAEVACVLQVSAFPLDRLAAPLQFDETVPPPPVPTVTVVPSDGLVDWQVVEITVVDAEPGSFFAARVCSTETFSCAGSAFGELPDGAGSVSMALPRVLQDGTDCAAAACEVLVSVFRDGGVLLHVPVSFDPAAPLAPPAAAQVVPSAGLWDGQRERVTAQRLDPGTFWDVLQCHGTAGAPLGCIPIGDLDVDALGNADGDVRVRRHLAGGLVDCASTACFVLVGPAVVPLTFDPDGPDASSNLPAQLPCVAWPTEGWPVGPLPAGVDAAAVDALGRRFVTDDGASSVVVIHGGRLVYEAYADGVTADTILPSFSVSKSFTSTIIGLLVDDGLLELDDPAPVPEWSAPGDPRGAITLRNLLNMSSGLQWNESYFSLPSDVIEMFISGDTVAYATSRPLEVPPGTRWQYSTGDTQILAGIIADVAGVSGPTYEAFLHEQLLDPLGIDPVQPTFDRAGTWNGGGATNTTTRNFAKLGLLYLRGGVWEDEQFLSREWVDFVRTPAPTFSGYGGQFWLDGDGSFRMVGLNGQAVHIVPELDLIVAVNQGGDTREMVNLFRDAARPSCGASPAARDDRASVGATHTRRVDVLRNDTGGDVGLAPETLSVATPPAHGTAVVDDGRIRYDSGAGFAGVDSFTYAVCTTDRRTCVDATVTVDVRPIEFEFVSPIVDGINEGRAGRNLYVPFHMPDLRRLVTGIDSLPVDCATGAALGPPEAVVASVRPHHPSPDKWIRWPTDPGWTGCRDLRVHLADGTTHTARFGF